MSERKADGSYNFDRKNIYTIVHDDGTVEYPLLNSGKLRCTRDRAAPDSSRFAAYSGSESTAQFDRIVPPWYGATSTSLNNLVRFSHYSRCLYLSAVTNTTFMGLSAIMLNVNNPSIR
ncbi:hypothetical protein [Vibrio coralliilyticus]|uniref:hypothetical protein n=1 Tax=Vibrio coralliilyticus TaxID=190893 RepID=UPI0020A4DD13|nr:hypothetical protein [Vibrio coralliilyticus]